MRFKRLVQLWMDHDDDDEDDGADEDVKESKPPVGLY